MLRLLTIEFHKLKHNTASKILIIIYFGLLISIALIAAIKFDIGPIKFHLAEMGIFNFLLLVCTTFETKISSLIPTSIEIFQSFQHPICSIEGCSRSSTFIFK